jgi:MATE family multidrug resistance protein
VVYRGLARLLILLGIFTLISFYIVGIPIGLFLSFNREWKLVGIWAGLAIGLFCSSMAQLFIIYKIDWLKQANIAAKRLSLEAGEDDENLLLEE